MFFRLILNIARRICDAHVFAAQAVAAQVVTKFSTVLLVVKKSRTLELLAFDE